MAGTLFVVATPIGNLEDISARAIRVLREVSVIAAEDTRRTGHLLQRFGLTTRTISFHEHSAKGKAEDLIARLRAGESIALVSDAGTPAVSDPGQRLVQLAHDAGVKVEPIPGPSAAVAAISASGFGDEGFLFLGFPPIKGRERRAWLDKLAAAKGVTSTVVFYEAPHRIVSTLEELHRLLGDAEILIARELTKAHEELRRTSLANPEVGEPRGEFTVVVDIGHLPSTGEQAAAATPESLRLEFGQITKDRALTRRQAISALAKKYGIPARDVFAMLEAGKPSVL